VELPAKFLNSNLTLIVHSNSFVKILHGNYFQKMTIYYFQLMCTKINIKSVLQPGSQTLSAILLLSHEFTFLCYILFQFFCNNLHHWQLGKDKRFEIGPLFVYNWCVPWNSAQVRVGIERPEGFWFHVLRKKLEICSFMTYTFWRQIEWCMNFLKCPWKPIIEVSGPRPGRYLRCYFQHDFQMCDRIFISGFRNWNFAIMIQSEIFS